MAQQTAVEWLRDNFHNSLSDEQFNVFWELCQQAKHMEKEQMIEMYNAGYTDSQCNHINDAENYVNELLYVKGRE